MGIVDQDDENLSKHHRKRKHFLAQELEERAKSEERKRISRDLHDRVAHDLGVAHQSLQLYNALKHRDPKTAAEKIVLANEAILRAMQSVRNLSKTLHETERVDGLEIPLSQALREVLKPGMEYRLHVHGDEEHLTPRTCDQLYLAVREAIRNAAVHSGASCVVVEIKVSSEEAFAIVEDDGRGFELEEAKQRDGSGIRFMEERAELVGGSCSIYARSDGGTCVEFHVPLKTE
jgi:signal transduction histidine kinase